MLNVVASGATLVEARERAYRAIAPIRFGEASPVFRTDIGASLDLDALPVFHGELDLAPFKVKVRVGGGLAGHNGLRSIDAALGPEFRRVRIGIGHPGPGRKDLVTPHVLGDYAKSEMEPLSDMLAAIAAEAEWLAAGDDPRFMSEVALRLQQD